MPYRDNQYQSYQYIVSIEWTFGKDICASACRSKHFSLLIIIFIKLNTNQYKYTKKKKKLYTNIYNNIYKYTYE